MGFHGTHEVPYKARCHFKWMTSPYSVNRQSISLQTIFIFKTNYIEIKPQTKYLI